MLSLLALTITAKPPKVPEIMEHSRPFYLHPTAARIIDSLAELGYRFRKVEGVNLPFMAGGMVFHNVVRVDAVHCGNTTLSFIGERLDSIKIYPAHPLVVEYSGAKKVVWIGEKKVPVGRIFHPLK